MYEKSEAARAQAKAELTAFIKDWCAQKHGNLKRLAEAANIQSGALHGYLSGTGRVGLERLIELGQIIISME